MKCAQTFIKHANNMSIVNKQSTENNGNLQFHLLLLIFFPFQKRFLNQQKRKLQAILEYDVLATISLFHFIFAQILICNQINGRKSHRLRICWHRFFVLFFSIHSLFSTASDRQIENGIQTSEIKKNLFARLPFSHSIYIISSIKTPYLSAIVMRI